MRTPPYPAFWRGHFLVKTCDHGNPILPDISCRLCESETPTPWHLLCPINQCGYIATEMSETKVAEVLAAHLLDFHDGKD